MARSWPPPTSTPISAATAAVPDAIPDGQTRRAIVRLLLESGSITVGEIGDRLGLAAAGVRRHLDALIDAGDAESLAAAARAGHLSDSVPRHDCTMASPCKPECRISSHPIIFFWCF